MSALPATVPAAGARTLGGTRRRKPWARRRSKYDDGGPGTRANIPLRLLGAAVVACVFLVPYIVMLFGAFKSRSEILQVPPTYVPEQWQPENFLNMWSTPETPLAMNVLSTVVISVGATVLTLLVALPAAYYTARVRFPGRLAFLFLVLVTQMLQPAVLVAGLFRQFLAWGIDDTWLAMILINAAFNMAFATWIMHAFFASIPNEVDEAAQLDGAGRLQVLFQVNLPLVWPGMVTAIIFTFVASWNEYAASLVILNSPERQPLPVALTRFIGQYESAWQYVFGVSLVAIIPVVIVFAIIEKRLVSGLTAGSVK